MDKARLATRVALKDQKGHWDRLTTVLKLKDSEVAEVLLDTLVNFLLLGPIGINTRSPGYMLHVVPSHSSGLTPVLLFPKCGFLCVIRS